MLPPDVSGAVGDAGAGRLPCALQRAVAHLRLPHRQPGRAGRRCCASRSAGCAGRSTPRRMHAAAQALLGEHDFSAFRAAECQSTSAVAPDASRSRSSARGERSLITVRANAFLHHMVRNIAGALIAVGTGRAPPRAGSRSCSRRGTVGRAAATAPAAGPVPCRSVEYPAAFGLPPPGAAGSLSGRRRRIDSRGHRGAAVTWFEKIMPSRIKTERRTRSVPEGLWIKCPACDAVLYRAELERNLQRLPEVQPSHAHRRSRPARPLPRRGFRPRARRRRSSRRIPSSSATASATATGCRRRRSTTGEKDALVVMAGTLKGLPVVACAFEFRFLGGSMGSVVGERFARAAEHCLEERSAGVLFRRAAARACRKVCSRCCR